MLFNVNVFSYFVNFYNFLLTILYAKLPNKLCFISKNLLFWKSPPKIIRFFIKLCLFFLIFDISADVTFSKNVKLRQLSKN